MNTRPAATSRGAQPSPPGRHRPAGNGTATALRRQRPAPPPAAADLRAGARPGRVHAQPRGAELPRPERGRGLFPVGGRLAGGANGSVDIDGSQAQTAYGNCRHLLPGGPSISQLEQDVQQEQQAQAQALPLELKYSQCMRSHGVPDFPGPGQATAAAGSSSHQRQLAAVPGRGGGLPAACSPAGVARDDFTSHRRQSTSRVMSRAVSRRPGGGGWHWLLAVLGPERGRRPRGRPGRSGRHDPSADRPGRAAAGDPGGRAGGPVVGDAGERDPRLRGRVHGHGPGGGTLTWLPSAGQVIGQGQRCTGWATAARSCCCTGRCRTGAPWTRGSPGRT